MEDEELRDDDLPGEEFVGDLSDDGDDVPPVEEGEEEITEVGEVAAAWEWKPLATGVAHEAKLRELLRNLCLTEVRIYSDASKEFVALLKGESGADLLLEYVRSSPRLSELLEAWRLHQGKPGVSYVLKLVAEIVGHAFGRSRSSGISRNIDIFARSILASKLEDLYTELKSGESKRQAAALSLLAAIVRRGVVFASELGKNFLFNLPAFQKLAGSQAKKGVRDAKHRTSRSTRRAFVDFAVSFLEVGNPRLLRWILQQKDMYSGVLRGLGSDDQETIIYILSVLRDKVLCADSLVPPGLRSVLFGSMTLEQLSFISGNAEGGEASDLAHEVLLTVCTDPCNGLMPCGNLKGNVKRLSDLVMKLKATESIKHKELLLAIVKGRPLLCSSYLDEFPYHLEPRASSQWYSAISLAADLISSANFSTSFSFLEAYNCGDPPSLETKEVQCILKCIMPRSCGRAVTNKGLLHSDILVKHGTIRLVLEALKLLDSLNTCISCLLDSMRAKQSTDLISEAGFLDFSETSECDAEKDDRDEYIQKWVSFIGQIQDETRSVLPDPQVLLKLLTSFNNEISRTSSFCQKRCLNSPEVARKKSKHEAIKDVLEVDIVVGVSDSSEKIVDVDAIDKEKQRLLALSEIWGPNSGVDLSNTENMMPFLYAKLLDSLRIYLRALPLALEGSFDFMKILTNDPSKLSITLQESVVSLLLEYTGQAHDGGTIIRVPPVMYKSLHLLLGLLIFSPNQIIRSKVLTLAKTAMLNTGAFDRNISEIEAWLLLLPGYRKDGCSDELQGTLKLKGLSSVVISFLCDAVSTVANNLYKYLDQLRAFIFKLSEQEDACPDFSPLVICIIQKCIRVLESDSRTFNLTERTMISLYVRNTLSFILHTQVNLKILPGVITLILEDKLNEPLLRSPYNCRKSLCEWRPLNELLLLATAIYQQQVLYPLLSPIKKASKGDVIPFYDVLNRVTEFLKNDDKDGLFAAATAMCFSIVCIDPDEVLENLPILLAIIHHLPTEHIQFLSFVLFQCEFLGDAAHLWDMMFLSNLSRVGFLSNEDLQESDDHNTCYASEELMAVGFSFLLENAPFYALFSGMIKSCFRSPFKSSRARDLLCSKLEGIFTGDWSLPLRFVLFWAYEIRLWQNKRPSGDLEQMFELSSSVLNHILDKALVQSSHSDVLKVVDLIIHHPVVTLSILHPFCVKNSKHGDLDNGIIHQMDAQILQLLKRLGDFLQVYMNGSNPVAKFFRQMMEQLVILVKEEFEIFIKEKDFGSLCPIIHIFKVLMQFISLSRLMETVNWMLCRIEANICYFTSIETRVLSIFFDIVYTSLEKLCNHLNSPIEKMPLLQWEQKNITISASILRNLYNKVLKFAIHFRLDSADSCLLKLVNAICSQKLQKTTCSAAVLPLVMQLCRIVNSSSMKLIIHCIHKTSKIKARILFQLVETSPLHRSLFGMAFLRSIKGLCSSSVDIMWPPEFDMISSNCSSEILDDDLLLLLPAALSYATSVHQGLDLFGVILSLYSKVLLKGFENWQMFTSGMIFYEDFNEGKKPTSMEEFLLCFRRTLLGEAVCMLHLCFLSKIRPMKNRYLVDTFNSLFVCSSSFDQVLDANVNEVEDSFNVVNRAMAKVSFAQLLLLSPKIFTPFSELHFDEVSESQRGKTSSSKNSAKLRFLDILVHSLNNLVEKLPWNPEHTKDTCMFRFLELHILGTIVQLSIEMKDFLVKLPTISFLKPLVRTLLLHRFDDPDALRVIRVLVCNLETRSSASEILELLIGHSEFINTILWNDYKLDSPASVNVGTLLQPVGSIFKLLDENTKTGINDKSPNFECKSSYMHLRKLELIKLLRVLFFLKNTKEDVGVNSRELLSLLLSGYGATLSEIDLQTLHFIHEIESLEGSGYHSVAEMDYLWGKSAVKLRRERNFNEGLSTNDILDLETDDEKRKRLFRENLPLDSKRCMMLSLNFCYNRTEVTEPISLKSLLLENPFCSKMPSSSSSEIVLPYDPGFLLPLSVHCLRRGYVEPVEFVRLGLLAVVLQSISSSDEDIRKSGYEALAIFKAILESFRRSKDILQLQLLLAYLQNGISEENQKIPSLTAVFSAEASFILLDPSHNSFQVINKFLMHSPRADFKDLPLFDSSLASHSIHFKGNFLWILKLIYVGLNFDDDARIVSRKHLFEHLMSLYVSSLSDSETKTLILQIVKKSIKLGMLSTMLVKHHGLIPWLCSVMSLNAGRLLGDQKEFSLNQLGASLEVIDGVVQSRTIHEWLKDEALEQLSDLSLQLHSILIKSSTLFRDHTSIIDSMLSVIISTSKISQERDSSQPHFFMSIEALFQLCRTLESINTDGKPSSTVRLGLEAILTGTPPPVKSQMEKSKLLKIASWAVSTCQSVLKTHPNEEHVLSKLLRWITASIILGSTSEKKGKETEEESLEDLLGQTTRIEDEHGSHISKNLGGIILHIRYLLGPEFSSGSSSVVAALGFLLSPSRNQTGTEYENIVSSICGKIRRPCESRPCWKWSFHQPWKDLSRERNHLQDLEEEQSCQALLLLFSNALGEEHDSEIQLYRDLEDSGLFLIGFRVWVRLGQMTRSGTPDRLSPPEWFGRSGRVVRPVWSIY